MDPPPSATPSHAELEEFKQVVTAWVGYDDTVRKLQTAISERRAAMRVLKKRIIDFMQKFNIDSLSTKHGKISLSTGTSKAPLRVTDIRQSLAELSATSPAVDVGTLIKTLFEAPRPAAPRTSLRRILPKVSTSLEI